MINCQVCNAILKRVLILNKRNEYIRLNYYYCLVCNTIFKLSFIDINKSLTDNEKGGLYNK
jgi:hypothetical protein